MKLSGILLFIFLFTSSSCNKDCEVPNQICNETTPNEGCQAYFTRWFYNKKKNKCEKISYSGCREYGFETEQECKECKCR